MAINVSNAFRELLEADKRDYIYGVKITLTDGTVLTLSEDDFWDGFEIEDAVSGDDDFQIGSAIINKLTLTLINMYDDFSEYDFFGAEVKVTIGLELPDGTTETIDKGMFYVDDPRNDTDLITLECLDNMAKFDRPYSESTLAYPATRGEILRDACTRCGVTLDTTTFDGSTKVVQNRPSDETLTYRQVVAWIAQLSCKWARCNNQGHLELGWYDMDTLAAETPQAGSYHDIDELTGSPTFAQDDVVITGIQVVTTNADGGTQTHLSGSQGYVLSVEGNDLIGSEDGGTIASELGEKLIGMRFRPMEITCPDDPTREAGDVMIVTDDRGNVYRSVITRVVFTADDDQAISCGAEAPGIKRSTRYSETTKAYVFLRGLIQTEKTARQQAVENLAGAIAESSGMYPTYEEQEDGSTITFLHDKPSMEESQVIIAITAEAIGVSNDGGKTWPYGFVLTGELITRLLYAEGIDADYIDTGALTVKDSSGNVIFQANISTGQVIISGDHVTIGSKNATEAIQDALNKAEAAEDAAADAKTMAMTLSNDYQAIPVDAAGNYEVFPECETEVTVFYGNTNITSECVFTIEKSAAVTGSWDGSGKIYTVTGLSADSGWVDIKATYLNTLTVTKRFSVAKLYAGQDGEASSYILEASDPLIKIGKDVTDPISITFCAYRLTGEERSAYLGRFKIEETLDGSTWNTVYTSDGDESEVTRYFYSGITDGQGNFITNENEDFIGTPRIVLGVRCSLYASGGTTALIDEIIIPSVKDVYALTYEEIFNLLTNNGEIKGIYLEGGQLYISFTYAKGGTLALGGRGNGNGLLQILDSSGNVIGYINNTGVHFEKGEFSGTLNAGKVTGSQIEGSSFDTPSADGKSWMHIENGEMDFYDNNADTGYRYAGAIYPSTEERYYESSSGMFVSDLVASMNFDAEHFFSLSVGGMSAIYSYVIENNRPRIDIYGDLYTAGNATFQMIASTGTKSRLVETDFYGTRKQYCYETPTPYFGDIGTAQINDQGICYVSIDDIFAETVNAGIEYQVFLQKEGQGDLWVDSKEAAFFVVKGTPGLKFSWELKVIQSGFEYLRLDDTALSDKIPDIQTELYQILLQELVDYEKEMEGLLDG